MKMPATVKELQSLLEARKLYPHYAAADGTDPYDGFGLKRYDDSWMVYRSGHMSGMKAAFFDNEQDAVKGLIDRLRKYRFADAVADIE